MARKSASQKVNRSEVIREYLGAHPEAMPKEVQTALSEQQGVDVSLGLVSNIKYGAAARKAARKEAGNGRRRRAGRKAIGRMISAPTVGAKLSAQDLFEAKRLADQLGGIEQAREALAALEKLQ